MSLADYLWLVRLIIEILKAIADMAEPDRLAIAQLRMDSEKLATRARRKKPTPSNPTEPTVT